MKLSFAVLGSTLLLCQCAHYHPGRADGIDPNPFSVLEQQATAETRDPSRISVPVLRSPALGKHWGAPKLLVGPKGGYALRYEDPLGKGRQLTIFGSPQLFDTAGPKPPPYTELGFDAQAHTYSPREVAQSWRPVGIAGKNVRYYISEGSSQGQPTHYSTETFRLTAPDGRTASYRLRASTKAVKATDDIESLLRTAKF